MIRLVTLEDPMFRDFSFLAAARPCSWGIWWGRLVWMADAHEERALLDLCNANGLRLSTPCRAGHARPPRSGSSAHSAIADIPLWSSSPL